MTPKLRLSRAFSQIRKHATLGSGERVLFDSKGNLIGAIDRISSYQRETEDDVSEKVVRGLFSALLASGRVMVMVVPRPGPGLAAVASQPCWRAMLRTRKRPRPVPLIFARERPGTR